jgi:hypothetical protein
MAPEALPNAISAGARDIGAVPADIPAAALGR